VDLTPSVFFFTNLGPRQSSFLTDYFSSRGVQKWCFVAGQLEFACEGMASRRAAVLLRKWSAGLQLFRYLYNRGATVMLEVERCFQGPGVFWTVSALLIFSSSPNITLSYKTWPLFGGSYIRSLPVTACSRCFPHPLSPSPPKVHFERFLCLSGQEAKGEAGDANLAAVVPEAPVVENGRVGEMSGGGVHARIDSAGAGDTVAMAGEAAMEEKFEVSSTSVSRLWGECCALLVGCLMLERVQKW